VRHEKHHQSLVAHTHCFNPALLPENWTVYNWSFPGSFPAGRRSGADEGIEFIGRAEGVYTETGDDGGSAAEICRKAGMSHATYLCWRKKYAGRLPDEMRPLKA
jgi:hypothetical protein